MQNHDEITYDDIERAKEILETSGYYVKNLWSAADINLIFEEYGEECTDEDVQKVFEIMGSNFNAEYGINWSTIRGSVEQYLDI